MKLNVNRFAHTALSLGLTLVLNCAMASAIDVPAGRQLELKLEATGVQIYDCLASPAGPYAWTFKAPEATLVNTAGEMVARHYAGPRWESVKDASTVEGTRLASEASLSPGAITQLLLSTVVVKPGAMFGSVTFIQRVNTVGGSAPATGCDATAQGTQLRVPYTASYLFFR
jgi:hypothetical protein